MKNMKDKVLEKLKEFDIEIYNESEFEDEYMINAKDLAISCKDNEVFVNFHILSKPSYAARIIVVLKDIPKIKFFIGTDFIFDENGKFMDGEEAEDYSKKVQKTSTINQFMEQQHQLYYLTKAESYTC